jgi:hypothetical protein
MGITGMKKVMLYDGLTSLAGNKNKIMQKLKRNFAKVVFCHTHFPVTVKNVF